MRAVGPITEKRGDITVVLDPLTIFAYDWIIHPSHAIAYMDSIESDSTFKNESGMLSMYSEATEDIFMPYNEDGDIMDYIRMQSRNFRVISEQFEMEQTNMSLSEDCRYVYAKQSNGDTIAIKTEDILRRELNSYMKRL